ncbi:amino-acid permease gap1 [Fusarium langsethiae]|uniref:Amino-acid permease gap1 n=1 Tax=Fusarium langsethiae TaxID=179993 RepID=A0A0N0DDC0_FUSLA|nr:amino-acid permease gap1 [Fusarium langsethiae]
MQAIPPSSPKTLPPAEASSNDSNPDSTPPGVLHRLLTSFTRAPPPSHSEDEYSLSSYNTSYATNGRLFNMSKANYNSANTALARELKNRHLQMIAFGGSIGTGLFVASGVALFRGGPASLLIAFVTMGTMQFFTMQALGELSVAFPVGGSFSNYSTRFLDPSWGFAMVLPLEIIAGAFTTNYWNPNASKSLFIVLFFFLILGINLLGVKGYGEAEFIFSAVKITAVMGFILLGIIINIAGEPDGGYIGFSHWHNPGAFNNGFKGFASVLVTATFSFAGTEMVGLAAAETSNPKKSLPAAVKQVFWRISLFYILSILLIGLLVPYNEPRLLGAKYGSDAAASPFVIAIEMSGSEILPDIMNAVILISLISVGNTAVYASSRTIAALAEQSLAPKVFAYIDRTGRPLIAIICCGTVGLLAFVANSEIHNEIFNWLLAISGLSTLFTWASICICHIRFRKAWQLSGYKLSQLAFKSQVGVWGSWVALIAYTAVLLLQFWVAISPIQPTDQAPFTTPERIKNFFLQVLTVPVIIIFYIVHKIWVGTKVVRDKDIDIHTGHAWIYYPPSHTDGDKRGLVINWHGGGCMLPNLGMDHEFCERVAVEGNILVLDADYRKAPNDPFPAAIEDTEDTLRWVESQSHMFDLDHVALSGFSSGGNLALVASCELRREFKNINIRAVYSFYPGVDFTIPPEQKIVTNPIRPLPFWFQRLISEAYLPRVGDRKSPRASPMYADTMSFPACVMLFTCSGDVLTPETEAFGEKLMRGGISVEVVRVQGAHAFDKTTSRRFFDPDARDMAYSKVLMSLKGVL